MYNKNVRKESAVPNLILNFTDSYPQPDAAGALCMGTYEFTVLDFSHLSGTDLYCDEEAQAALSERLAPYGPSGLHFLDSGNYHYVSKLFTSMIGEPYALIVFDHHTDMKPAMFDLLSCGAWVKHVLEEDPWVRSVLLIGPPEKSLNEIEDPLKRDPRLICVSEETFLSEIVTTSEPGADLSNPVDTPLFFPSLRERIGSLPLYLSIDKDLLRPEDARTNWDQGTVSLGALLLALKHLLPLPEENSSRLIGADICGLLPVRDGGDSGPTSVSGQSDLALAQALLPLL